MFPQVGRREIQWDLQRNGGSVAATTERILGSGRLETVGYLPFFLRGSVWFEVLFIFNLFELRVWRHPGRLRVFLFLFLIFFLDFS